jgi:POT family proton-dependent oligopeptide transporter
MKTETLKKETGKDVYFKNISPEQRAELEKTLKIKYTYTIQNYSVHQSVLGNCFNSCCCRFWALLRRKGKEPLTPTKIVLGYLFIILSGNGFSSNGRR